MRVFAAECANTERVISSKRALSDNKRIRDQSGRRNGNHSDRRFFRLLLAKLAICRNICPICCLMDRPCFYKSYFSFFAIPMLLIIYIFLQCVHLYIYPHYNSIFFQSKYTLWQSNKVGVYFIFLAFNFTFKSKYNVNCHIQCTVDWNAEDKYKIKDIFHSQADADGPYLPHLYFS